MHVIRGMAGLGVFLVLALVAGYAAGAVPPTTVAAAAGGVALVLFGCTVRPHTLVAAWAMILPIWSVGNIDPAAFDALRFVGAGLIFLRFRPVQEPWRMTVTNWTVVIAALAVFLSAAARLHGDANGLRVGYTALLGILAAWMVVTRVTDVRDLARGYLLGVTASAVVLILDVLGTLTISPNTDAGFSRATGLGASSVLVSFELALGILLALTVLAGSSHRFLVPLSALTCLAALLLCGGRGGVVAVTLAALFALRWGWLRLRHVVALVAFLQVGSWLAASLDVSVNTVDRFFDAGYGTDLTSGRADLFDEALAGIADAPAFGFGLTAFQDLYGATPHVAPMTFAIIGGLIPGAVMLLLLLQLARRALTTRGLDRLGPPLVGVLAAWSLLEPNGPFVGLEGATFLLLAVRLVMRHEQPLGGGPRTTSPGRSARPLPRPQVHQSR